MNRQRWFVTGVFALALGLGVWTVAAVSFQGVSSSFVDGEVVSAADFNDLFGKIDGNFSDAAAQINTNETDIIALQDGKVDLSGDTMTGTLNIQGGDGMAGFFQNESDSAPALYLKNLGAGPILQAVTPSGGVLEISTDGSVRIGGTASEPIIRLDGTTGTITNNVGSGLPLAFGTIDSDGTILSGTSNFSVTFDAGFTRYEIAIDGESYHYSDYAAMVTPITGGVSAETGSSSDNLLVSVVQADGTNAAGRFSFVVFKPGF